MVFVKSTRHVVHLAICVRKYRKFKRSIIATRKFEFTMILVYDGSTTVYRTGPWFWNLTAMKESNRKNSSRILTKSYRVESTSRGIVAGLLIDLGLRCLQNVCIFRATQSLKYILTCDIVSLFSGNMSNRRV